jgi:Uma2 family endonuclease
MHAFVIGHNYCLRLPDGRSLGHVRILRQKDSWAEGPFTAARAFEEFRALFEREAQLRHDQIIPLWEEAADAIESLQIQVIEEENNVVLPRVQVFVEGSEATLGTLPHASEPDDPSLVDAMANGEPVLQLAPEDYPDVSGLITEDNAPMDNIYTERQQRLLVEPLHSSWQGPGEGVPFVALANVGLFFGLHRPPLVPDCMLSLDVELPQDLRHQEHRSYFVWVFGKLPDVVVEIVSDRRGGEETFKMREYARQGILYYVIHDPDDLLEGGVLRVLELRRRSYEPVAGNWLSEVGLGLTLWQGRYEGAEALWLRWCDRDRQVIPTGQERAEQERQRAEQERQRADEQAERARRLEAQLRALGIEPSA